DINPGLGSGSPSNLTNVNGTLYFSANDGVNGTELWKSDGTTAGTTMVKDLFPGETTYYVGNPGYGNWVTVPNSSNLGSLTTLNGTLFFTATDGAHGNELWKSDGTAGGTAMVTDIRPGSESSNLGSLTNVNGTLYFRANGGINGDELWKSD